MSFATSVLQKMLYEARQQPRPPGDNADVLLLVGGGSGPPEATLRAHKLVLTTVSPIFHEWFRSESKQPAPEDMHGDRSDQHHQRQLPASAFSSPIISVNDRRQHRTSYPIPTSSLPSPRKGDPITVRLPEFPPEVVEAALDVIYGGQLMPSEDWTLYGQCWDFAVRFRIAHLREVARKQALLRLDQGNALRLLGFALAVHDEPAIDHVADYIAIDKHFVPIIQSSDFVLVEHKVLDAIVRPCAGTMVPGENITIEKVWFDALMHWLRQPCGDSDDTHYDMSSPTPDSERGGANLPKKLPIPTAYARLHHVDHVITLVDFNRMLTIELASVSEDTTARYATGFPHCLVPILAERTMCHEQEWERRIKDFEQEKQRLNREKSELSEAFKSAVHAKNESDRAKRIFHARLEEARTELENLRAALNERISRERGPQLPQILDRNSHISSPSSKDPAFATEERQRPRPVYGHPPEDLQLVLASDVSFQERYPHGVNGTQRSRPLAIEAGAHSFKHEGRMVVRNTKEYPQGDRGHYSAEVMAAEQPGPVFGVRQHFSKDVRDSTHVEDYKDHRMSTHDRTHQGHSSPVSVETDQQSDVSADLNLRPVETSGKLLTDRRTAHRPRHTPAHYVNVDAAGSRMNGEIRRRSQRPVSRNHHREHRHPAERASVEPPPPPPGRTRPRP